MEIGKIIKEERSNRNMTQEDLANEFFVSRQLISKWENGKSYPDLEQLLKLSDFFELTLDELMRGDKKMTKKLNFDIKMKKVVLYVTILFTIILGNYIISCFSFTATSNGLVADNVVVIRDNAYNGEDPHRDWNAVVLVSVKAKNPFFKPDIDSFLLSMDNNKLSGNMKWSFSIFNIFNVFTREKSLLAEQTALIYHSVDTSEITFQLNDSKENRSINIYN